MTDSIWERQDSVSRFANRDPDLRLLELLRRYPIPEEVRVLDLGCAGGRNCEVLAGQGFNFHALDGSRAMVAHTRGRVQPLIGEDDAARRVQHGGMADLGAFVDETFDLVVALGIYHCATSRAEWDSALSESARVLKSGGQLLVALFTPETHLDGQKLGPVSGESHVFEGLKSGRSFLVDQETLDAEMARFGLAPAVPSQTVRVEVGSGRRVVVNALFRRTG